MLGFFSAEPARAFTKTESVFLFLSKSVVHMDLGIRMPSCVLGGDDSSYFAMQPLPSMLNSVRAVSTVLARETRPEEAPSPPSSPEKSRG